MIKKERVFTILLAGDLRITPDLNARILSTRFIAADSGMRHARSLAIAPELWVGDFDSSTDADFSDFRTVERLTYPEEKDISDGELAIREAVRRGATELILCAAFGGTRLDHVLVHLTLAIKYAKKGLRIILTDGNQTAVPLLPGEHVFELEQGTRFSIVGLSKLSRLTISGAHWNLNEQDVPLGSSLTLSNKIIKKLKISFVEGEALFIWVATTGES